MKPCPQMTKKARQKFKYLQNEKSFQGEIKSIFHLFKRPFGCQKMSQTLECAFNNATLGPNLPVWPVQVLFFISECLFLSSKNVHIYIYIIYIYIYTYKCISYNTSSTRTFWEISLLSCYGAQSSTKDSNNLKINIVEFKIFRKLTPHPIAIWGCL